MPGPVKGRVVKKLVLTLALCSVAASVHSCAPRGEISIIAGDGGPQLFQPKSLMGRDLGLSGSKKIVLTFDDGPFASVTPQVLDTVEREGIRASFFMQGNHVDGNEALVQRMSDGGHSIGNHTFDHTGLKGLARKSWSLVYNELRSTDVKISPFLRPNAHVFFRAPGGSWTPSHTLQMNAHPELQKYIGPIYWDIGGNLLFENESGKPTTQVTSQIIQAADWDCWVHKISPELCAEGYLNEMKRHLGGIVLMHDRDQGTADMIKILIPEWKRQGYSFITMDEVPGLEKFE